MSNCVNQSHKDFKALQNRLTMHPKVLASKIATWQSINKKDVFPTLNELVTGRFDLQERNAVTLYNEKKEISQLGKLEYFQDYVRLIKGEPTVEGFRSFLEGDFGAIKINEDQVINQEIDKLRRGAYLTKEDLKNSKDALETVTQNLAGKHIKTEESSLDITDNISTISIIPNPDKTKIKTMNQAMEIANKIVRTVNSNLRHPSNKSVPIAQSFSEGNKAVVSFKYPQSDLVFRHYFDTKDVLVTPKLRNKLYEKKALINLLDTNRISPETFSRQMESRELFNYHLMLNSEEIAQLREVEATILPKVIVENKVAETVQEAVETREEFIERVEQEGQQLDFDFPLEGDASYNDLARNPINIEAYKKKKADQIKKIEGVISNLRNQQKGTGNYKKISPKIYQLEKIKDRFEEDLKSELLIEDPIQAVKKSFEKDLETIKKIQSEPSLDNIFIARDLLRTLQDNLEETYTNAKQGYIFSPEAKYKDIKEVTKDLTEEFFKLSSRQTEVSRKYFEDLIEKRFLSENIEELFPGVDKENLIQALIDSKGKEDVISTYSRSLGKGFSGNDPIGMLVRSEYGFEVKNRTAEYTPLRNSIDYLKDAIKDDLKALGFDSWFEAFSRHTSKGDVELISKYNENYKNFVHEKLYKLKKRAVALSKEAKYTDANRLYNKIYENLSDKVDFVDIHKLPEIADYVKGTDLENGVVGNRKYASELKKKLGEVEYEQLIERQIGFIESFRQKEKDIIDSIVKRIGVDSYSELTQEQQFKTKQLVNTYNPFYFSINKAVDGNNVRYVSRTGVTGTPHKLEFNSFIPKDVDSEGKPTNFKDEKFAKIESNPKLLEAWKTLEEATFMINSNYAQTHLNLSKRSLMYYNRGVVDEAITSAPKGLLGKIVPYASNLAAYLRRAFSSNQNTSKEDVIKLANNVQSFKNQITARWNNDLDALANILKYNKSSKSLSKEVLTIKDLSPNQVKQILDVFGMDSKTLYENKRKTIAVAEFQEYSQRNVYEGNKVDMPLLFKMMLELSALHKAKESALQTVENIIEPVAEDTNYYNNFRGTEGKKDFFKKQVLRNDREVSKPLNVTKVLQKVAKDGKIDFKLIDINTKNLTHEQKRVLKIARERLDVLRRNLNKFDESTDTYKDIEQEIQRLEDRIAQMGLDYTIGDMYEFLAIKLHIVSKLGLNVNAFIQNLLQSGQQNMIHAGYVDPNTGELVGDYTKQQYMDAHAFINSPRLNFNNIEQKKAHALISQLNVIQDGSDLEQRAERVGVSQKPTLDPRNRGFWSFMKLTEVSEYMNQVPTVLAVLSNYNMPDGSPMFTGHSLPYHEIKNGILVLKEEYLNKFDGVSPEEMKKRYESFTSKEASNLVVNLEQNVIPKRNGDYSETGVIMAKDNLTGRSLFTFGNWLMEIAGGSFDSPRMNLYTGKVEEGYTSRMLRDSELNVIGAGLPFQWASSWYLMAGTTLAAMASSFGFVTSLALPLATLGFAIAVAKRSTKVKGEKTLGDLLGKSLMTSGYNMTIGSLMPLAHIVTAAYNRVTKSNVKLDKLNFDYSFGGQLNPAQALALHKQSSQINLLQFISMIYTAGMMMLIARGGEEEEKENKGSEDSLQRDYYIGQDERLRETETERRQKKIFHNMMLQAYGDTGLTLSIQEMVYTLVGEKDGNKTFNPTSEVLGAALNMLTMDDEVVTDSKSTDYGKNKMGVGIYKAVVPAFFHNITKAPQGDWIGGLEKKGDKYYRESTILDFFDKTDLKKDQKVIADKRKQLRARIETNLEDYLPEPLIEVFQKEYNTTDFKKLPVEERDDLKKFFINPMLDDKFPSPKGELRTLYDEEQNRAVDKEIIFQDWSEK